MTTIILMSSAELLLLLMESRKGDIERLAEWERAESEASEMELKILRPE